MLTGFNHNIKHQGQVYHIQTEDSGVKAPHIITHLFVGGNIIATKKTSYADVVGSRELEEVVRKMMEEQHKQMLRNLIHGAYDKALTSTSTAATEMAISETEAAVSSEETPGLAPAPIDMPASIWDTGAPIQASPPATPPPEVVAAQNLAEKPVETPTTDTIFGEDLMSEKSLDEVILAYLADDMDGA